MRKLVLYLTATTGLVAAAWLPVQAAPFVTNDGLRPAIEHLNSVEPVQYIWQGRRHCWYPNGWHGAGWYWCGYAWRAGYGWGGPAGWQGWERRERFEDRRERRDRREDWRERHEYRRY